MYSSTNFLILGEIIEAVTGQPAEEVITDLAQRTGLDNSALQAPEDNELPDPSSHGYNNAFGVAEMAVVGVTATPGTDVTDWTVSWGQAAGSMYSTVEDLGTWAGTGLGTALLPTELGEQRLETSPIDTDPSGVITLDYGLGIMDFGNDWIGHTGQIIGWESMVMYNSVTGAAFVALVNETGSLLLPALVAANQFPDLAEGLA